jgi:hypothetical protein
MLQQAERISRDLASMLTRDIRAELGNSVKIKERSSKDSSSVYLFVVKPRRAVCIRISDHEKIVPNGRVRFETRRSVNHVFYLYTNKDCAPGVDRYFPSEINLLRKKVLEYLNVSS